MRAVAFALLACLALGLGARAGDLHPTDPSPPDGATEVEAGPPVCARVVDPEGRALDATFHVRESSAAPTADFTLLVLPDTQNYAQTYPQIFAAQTAWIAANRQSRNIAFVSHVGDCVQVGGAVREWSVADAAMRSIEDPGRTGLPEGIPYGIAVGNHDQDGPGAGTLANQSRTTVRYNQTFGAARFAGRGYYGGHFGTNNDNHYELFSAAGLGFIVIHLEYDYVTSPVFFDAALRAAVLDWADALLKAYPERRAIVTSHFILTGEPQSIGDFSDQGRAIYDALKDNPNLFLMLSGHQSYNPRRTDVFDGHAVHSVMSNYQFDPEGGNGWLRIYTFSPAHDEIRATTYSPWLDSYRRGPNDEFALSYDMQQGRPFAALGTVRDVPSGATACVDWPGRRPGATYEWYVELADGVETSRGPTWSFTGKSTCAIDADCADGSPCTSDRCAGTACSNDALPGCCLDASACDDGNPCTDDTCADGGCAHTSRVAACDDGDACTIGDACAAGTCAGTVKTCDDGNACTVDRCEAGACRSEPAPASGCCVSDGDCDDHLPCTLDRCTSGGDCAHGTLGDGCTGDDGDPCTLEVCTAPNAAAVDLRGGGYVTASPSERPVELRVAAGVFTLEAWFEWDGSGEAVATSAVSRGGRLALPLVTRGYEDPANRQGTLYNVNYFLGILAGGDALVADFEEHATGATPGQNHPVIGRTRVTPGLWHHAAATYDGTCWQLYLDGVADTDGTKCPAQPPDSAASAKFAVGAAQRFDGWVGGRFEGSIDEVRVWRRALRAYEVAAFMQRQIETDPDLLLRWGFDEGTGYKTAESTGRAPRGTLVGAAWDTSALAFRGGCASAHFPICSSDADGDAVEDVGDCAPEDPRVAWLPESVDSTLRAAKTGSAAELSWSLGPGQRAAVVHRGSFAPGQRWRYDEECLAGGNADGRLLDADLPPPGAGFYYLVGGQNACGEGPVGPGQRAALTSCSMDENDRDGDGVADLADNCPALPNPDQLDVDHDFIGNACDLCPAQADGPQTDADRDRLGDVCDTCTDRDADGFGDPGFAHNTCPRDNCPEQSNPSQADSNGNGKGDACERGTRRGRRGG